MHHLIVLEFLKKQKLEGINLVEDGEKVALIGGGNSAMDAARLAKRCGADITVVYRRTESEMPAFGNELAEAKDDGVKFDFLKGMENYKLDWTTDHETNYQLTYFSIFWGQLRLNLLRILLFYDHNKHRKISESFRLLINKINAG